MVSVVLPFIIETGLFVVLSGIMVVVLIGEEEIPKLGAMHPELSLFSLEY